MRFPGLCFWLAGGSRWEADGREHGAGGQVYGRGGIKTRSGGELLKTGGMHHKHRGVSLRFRGSSILLPSVSDTAVGLKTNNHDLKQKLFISKNRSLGTKIDPLR